MRGSLTVTQTGKCMVLPAQGGVTIGRAAGSGLELDDHLVSRSHCRIECDGDFFWLTDLNSKGGTLLNDAPIQKALLYDEDEIRLGQTLLVFSLVDGDVKPCSTDANGLEVAAVPGQIPEAGPPRIVSANDLVGQVLGGCRIEKRLDKRGTASVFEAVQLSMQRRVAVKILPPLEGEAVSAEQHQAAVDRFLRGARSAGRLNHTNIVTILDVGVLQDIPFAIMEFVEGMDLKSVLHTRAKRRAPLNLYTALTIAAHIARGLDHAYRKRIVHRNIKPRNILVDREGTAKLTGFGLARSLDDERTTGTGLSWEQDDVRYYLAPEQCKPEGVVDHRSDIYSLGAVLYHMATNEPPTRASSTDGPSVGQELPQWPADADHVPTLVREICAKAMCPDEDGRYSTPDEFQSVLRAARGTIKNGEVED